MENQFEAGIYINAITFSGGQSISLDKDDIVIIVGPNNSGKSVTLKSINLFVKNGKYKNPVVENVSITQTGDKKSWRDYFEKESIKITDQNQGLTFAGLGYAFFDYEIENRINSYSNGLGNISPAFCSFLGTEQRLSSVQPPPNINLTTQAPQHPIHFLQRDDRIEYKFSEIFQKAFGKDLIVHRNAGNTVPVYVGNKPKIKEGEDRVSMSYLERLEKLPTLHEQGDGMKSFVGVMLHTMIANKSITLIDEPEAFLHPPQARLLGQMLAKRDNKSGQLIISTHSGDFLRGIVDSSPENLRIIRIKRDGDSNIISELSKNEVSEIWNDPLLRHSNVLDGLFHERVVICEADSDCRFYSAVSQSIYEKNKKNYPDVLFTHCGGKHRMPVVIKALIKLGVPVSVITDFDVLNSENPFKNIWESLNGNWSEIEGNWKIVKAEIEKKKPELTSDDIKTKISTILNSITDRQFPLKAKTDIESILKRSSAWTHAKAIGKNYIPAGDAFSAFDRMLTTIKKQGLYIVEVGEVECFIKSVGNHGPKWVSEVLLRDIDNDVEFKIAKEFIKEII